MLKSELQKIAHVPDGATAVCTENRDIYFVIGATGKIISAPINDEQFAILHGKGWSGTFGQPIYDDTTREAK
jgi:hypothetical protein